MQPSSQTRFIALLVLTVVAIAGATFAILHRGVGRTASAASVAVVQPAAPAENPTEKPPAPTPPLATQPLQTQPLAGAPDDVTGFVSVAESEVAQLHSGVTLADWMSARGARERWTAAKPETQVDGPDEECLSLRRKDSLPSGAVVVRALYFYPPRVPSPIVFPKIDPSSPFSACTLAAVRLEAEAPAPANGHALAQAVAQRFTQTYGLSNDPEEVRRRRVKLWGEDGGHWVANIDITSSYDTKPGKDPDAPDQLIQGPVVRVSADLPHLDEMGNRSVLRRVDRPAEAAQFRRAVAAARVDAALSQRMEKLYELDVALGDRLNQEAEEMCKTRCPQDMPKPSGNDWREPLVPVLQDWFQALKAADPGRRAAGLLAADRLLLAFGRIRPGDHFGTHNRALLNRPSCARNCKVLAQSLRRASRTFITGTQETGCCRPGILTQTARAENWRC